MMAGFCVTVCVCLIGFALISVEAQDGSDNGALSAYEWNLWFTRVFVSEEGNEIYPTRVLNQLALLNKGSYEPIDSAKKEEADFWFDAVTYDIKHCSWDHLKALDTRYEKRAPREPKQSSIKLIYGLARNKTNVYCSNKFEQFATNNLAPSISKDVKSKLFEFGVSSIQIIYDIKIKKENEKQVESSKECRKSMLYLIQSKATTADEFIEDWRNYPVCNMILAKFEEPYMEGYKRLEEYLASLPGWMRYRNSSEADSWVKVIEGCKYFRLNDNLRKIWNLMQ